MTLVLVNGRGFNGGSLKIKQKQSYPPMTTGFIQAIGYILEFSQSAQDGIGFIPRNFTRNLHPLNLKLHGY